MRSSSKGYAFLNILDLSCQAEVCQFDLSSFEEDISRFDISMEETFWGKIGATWQDLFGESENVLWLPVEHVFFDVFFKILLAVFEEKVQIVACFLHIKELYNARMLQFL